MLKFTRLKSDAPVYINPELVISVSKYRNTHWMMDCTGIRMAGGEIIDVTEDDADVAAMIGRHLASAPTTV